MVTRVNRSPELRAPLSRERILRVALDLADRHGIGALSMRKLGQELEVDAMMLYRHVANKDDLLDGMVDTVFGEIGLPPSGADWRTAMRQRAVAARAALSRHPWVIGLMESRSRPGPATLRHHDAVLGSLREAGFSIEAAVHAYSLLDSYIYGFALNEQSLPLDTSEEVTEMGTSILRGFPLNAYPHLAEFINEHAMKPGYSYGDEFEFGLDLILHGLELVRYAA
jgi:AcrR family transcriptional regulator